MARNLLTVIFLFLFVLPAYAGKPVSPTVTTEPPLAVYETGVNPVCKFFTGSADMTLSVHFGLVGGALNLVDERFYLQSDIAFPLTYSGAVSGLTSGTQYQYQCSGLSSVGSSVGSLVTFCTLPGCPPPPPPPPSTVSPVSVTVGAELLPSYNGFNFQCSHMYGTSPTRLFMRLNANGMTRDYNYGTVLGVYTYTEFFPVQFSSYDLFTEAVKPSPFVPLMLDMNTLYQYQCCSENSFGSSCGDTGSIYTAPYTLSFNYDFAPDWPRSVSYGVQSIWTMTINNITDFLNCAPGYMTGIYYLASDNTIQLTSLYSLFYDPNKDGVPDYNCCSSTGTQSCSDAFRWDCFPKDGILDAIDIISGKSICAVLFKDGYEHFLTCPSGNVSGKPLYAVSSVGGFSGINQPSQNCPQVPFPFGSFFSSLSVNQSKALGQQEGTNFKSSGRRFGGHGGYEKRY